MICQICNKEEAIYKIGNQLNNQEFILICEFCETPNHFELIEELKSEKQKQERTSKFGRLHIIHKSRLDSVCFFCKNEIPKGNQCYNQKEQIEGMVFPLQRKCCKFCGEKKINEGCEVAK